MTDVAAAPAIIELAGVEKTYRSGRVGFRALNGVDLAIVAGEMVAITGRLAAARPRSSTSLPGSTGLRPAR